MIKYKGNTKNMQPKVLFVLFVFKRHISNLKDQHQYFCIEKLKKKTYSEIKNNR